jgi:serine/threonine protein kinase
VWGDIKNLSYYKESFPKWKKVSLEEIVKDLDSCGIDLLNKMLTYDPNLRISAKDALKHVCF